MSRPEAAAVYVRPDELRAWAKNPRKGKPVAEVAESIRRFGFAAPIVARRDGTVIAGHTRLEAAVSLGLDRVPVRFLDLDEQEAAALALADNRLSELAEWDTDGLAGILAELETASVPIDGLGWDGDALADLLGRGDELPPGTGPTDDRAEYDEVDDGLRAPFPWFGGKSRAAPHVWAVLGDVDSYVEPFAGSLAVLLRRPHAARTETVNDRDGFIVNFWRAVAADPEAVAKHVDWPVAELDLTARHLWLVGQRAALTARLEIDPDHHDAKIAGWWCWGICSWIGSGWCSGDGPWTAGLDGIENGNAGMGVHRQLPHLGNAGRGVHRQLPHLGNAGMGGVEEWLAALALRLRRVRVCSGDWSRVVTPSARGGGGGVCGVFLDPPYPEGWDPDGAYADGVDAGALWRDVTAWAADATREDPALRVVVAGYDGTWSPPVGWTVRRWRPRKGYQSTAAALGAIRRDVLWCSPACLRGQDPGPGALDDAP